MKKGIIALFCLLLTLYSCQNFDSNSIENLNGGKVQIIGHAGLGFHRWFPFNPYPSNSFTSIKKAIEEEKAEGIEVDVQMTKDGYFVLYHDNKLESMTAMQGCVSNYDIDDILLLNYQLGYPFDAFQSENIISFKQLIDYLNSLEDFPILHLDLRTSSDCLNNEESKLYRNRFVRELLSFLKANEVSEDKMLLISTDKRIFTLFEDYNCPYPTSYEVTGDFEEDLEWANKEGVSSFTVKPKILTQARSKAAHKAGISIVTFGAKSKSGNQKLLALNPDALQTDNISALKDLLGK